MSWYAVKTVPGAQLPRKEYVVKLTRSTRGYRVEAVTNPSLSLVERALEDGGFEHYMPTEKRLVRDRRHTDLYKVRRFALMVGYIFVRDPRDWRRLEETNGVAGIVRTAEGQPFPIDILEILAIRTMEAEYDALFDIQSKNARAKLRKNAKKDPRLKKLVGALDMAGTMTVPVNSDVFEGAA